MEIVRAGSKSKPVKIIDVDFYMIPNYAVLTMRHLKP